MYESLTAYIPDLEKGNFGDWTEQTGDGTKENPYVFCHIEYSEPVHKLLDALGKFRVAHREEMNLADYPGIMDEIRSRLGGEIAPGFDVSLLDGRLIVGFLLVQISLCRFDDELFLNLCRDGTVLRCLKRLKEIDEGEGKQGFAASGATRDERCADDKRGRNQDKFRGCLIGGAAGDALGYEIEFWNENRIFSRYGDRGITEYELHDGKALISDDTQMTLFTATGLLERTTRGKLRGIAGPFSSYIHHAYTDWLKTQENRYPLPEEYHYSWLVNVPELFDRRAPGNTCMEALRSGECGSIEKPINSSKGCGGVMRVAPIGLYFNGREMPVEEIARIGAEAAAITHGHILGWLPAAALVQIIHEISQNDVSVFDAVMKTLNTQEEMWPDSDRKTYFLKLMRRAVGLAGAKQNDLEAIHQLGEGWVAEEALAIAVYCALKYENDFDSALIAAVNHKGDSDSTGAICGNILGARLGLNGIPEKYITNLELKDLILEIADDLYHDCRMSEYDSTHDDPVWIQKYVKMTWPAGAEKKTEDIPSDEQAAGNAGVPSVLIPGFIYDPETKMIRSSSSGKKVRDIPVSKLNLSTRARNIFIRDQKVLCADPAGEVMISDLLRLSRDAFYGLKNMGVKTADETLELIVAWLSGDSESPETDDSSSPAPVADTDPFIVPEYRLYDGVIRNASSLLEVPDAPVDVLDLSVRAGNVLRRENIAHLHQLVSLRLSDLKNFRALGALTETEIVGKLKTYLDEHILPPGTPGYEVRDGLIIHLASSCVVPDQLIETADFAPKTKQILLQNSLYLFSDLVSMNRVQLLSLEGMTEKMADELVSVLLASLDSTKTADPVVLPGNMPESLCLQQEARESVLAGDYCLLNGIVRNRITGRAIPEALVSSLNTSALHAALLKAAGYPSVSLLIGLKADVLMKDHAFSRSSVHDISRALEQYLQRKERGQAAAAQEAQASGSFGEEELLQLFHEHEFDVLSSADIREAFPDVKERLLLQAVSHLVRDGLLIQDGDRYSLHHDTLYEYVQKLLEQEAKHLNARNVNVLLRRMNGETLVEIGDSLGMTRERIRQLEEKAKETINHRLKADHSCLEEDRWQYLFTTYGGTRELYLKHLRLPELMWNYLGLKYKRGSASMDDALADELLPAGVRRAIEQYIHEEDVRLDGVYLPAKRMKLEDYVAEKFCRDDVSFDDYCSLYNDFLQQHGISDENLLITNAVKSSRQNHLADSDVILWKQDRRLRYYDIAGRDYTDLFAALELSRYKDIEISARKLLLENREIMRRYDIRDEYELHNLLKKLHAESENPSLTFGRMPMLLFGRFDRDEAVRDILFAMAPVNQDELAEMISLEYGVAVPTVKANWLSGIQEYYHMGMYSVEYEDLPEEHAALLKQELTDDCYLISEVKDIYSRLAENADTTLISSYNMKKMGFQVGVGYVLQHYPSMEAYLDHLLTAEDMFDFSPLRARFGSLNSFHAHVTEMKNNLDIIEFGEDRYITFKSLENLGVTREGIRQFRDRVLAFHSSDEYFSWPSLKKAGFSDDMEKLGFGYVFLTSLLKADPRLSWQSVGGAIIFNPKNEAFAIRDFIRFVVEKTGPQELDALSRRLLEDYGSELAPGRILERVSGAEMYYDPVAKKLYPSVEAYDKEYE
ncbi:MAG: ADP-ribosylglycohydrolase family protein [Clostridia bacterium]|nr:ADP-ribosylglycohydrolase family protein [Clostridia bacterium]